MKQYIHHIVLTVTDIKKSTEFYRKLLVNTFGWKIRGQEKEYTEFVPPKSSDGIDFLFVIGVPRDQPNPKSPFDRNNIGLDHFAFMMDSMEELQNIEKQLKDEGITLENGGITDDGFSGTAIFAYDPDGMKVEFHLRE